MATLRLTGTAGEVEDASPEQVREAFERVARAEARGQHELFAIAERADGAFVQMWGEDLEVKIGDVHRRLDLGALAARLAERLARGEEPWGDLPHEDAENRVRVRSEAKRTYWRNVLIGTLITVFAFAALTLAAMLYVNWRAGS